MDSEGSHWAWWREATSSTAARLLLAIPVTTGMAAEIKTFWQGDRAAQEFSTTIQSPLLVGHQLKSAFS